MSGKAKQKQRRATGFLDDYVEVRYAGEEANRAPSNEFTQLIDNEEMGEGNRRNNSEELVPQGGIPEPQEVEQIGEDNQNITNTKAVWNINKAANGARRVNASPDNPLGIVPMRNGRSEWGKLEMERHHQVRKSAGAYRKFLLSPLSLLYQTSKIVPNARMWWGVQKKRDHSMVPGREEETFEENPGEGDILNDFRRVPTVWSRLTAAKATNERGEDMPPKVSVYIEQPEAYSRETLANNNMGHAMLGIEYTGRPSKITGQKERYKIRYGFYPAGGMTSKAAINGMAGRGGEVPGELQDDDEHPYDISKTYTVSKEQAVRIAEASEEYTEKGGYGYYTRNCTTFVRDMFRVGRISDTVIDTIFTEEMVRFAGDGNKDTKTAGLFCGFADTNTKWKLGRLANEPDLSYQGWGNRRATMEEVRKYNKTKNSVHGKIITTLTPADAGENIRNMTDVEGQLGSYKGLEIADDVIGDRYKKIRSAGRELSQKIDDVLISHTDIRAIGGDFGRWFKTLTVHVDDDPNAIGASLYELWGIGGPYPTTLTQRDIKEGYAILEQQMADVSMYYQRFLFSDSRINREVMNLLSRMQQALSALDDIYQEKKKAEDEGGLRTLRENTLSQKYTVKVGNTEVSMTPSHYEAYLQIYKKPEAAVAAYARYKSLKWELERNKKEEAEFQKLDRAEKLARQLDLSHRQMLNKDEFSQSDIDYAFRLRNRENVSSADAASGTMFAEKASASMTYITLMYDKIFAGIQNALEQAVNAGRFDIDDEQMATEWLDNYLAKKASEKAISILMILRGIKRVLKQPTADGVKRVFHGFLKKHYLQRAFPTDNSRGRVVRSFGSIKDDCYDRMCSNQMAFPLAIDAWTMIVLREKEEKKPKAARR